MWKLLWPVIALLAALALAWQRAIFMRDRGLIPRHESLVEAMFRVTVFSFFAAVYAGFIAGLRAFIKQWKRGYSGQPPLSIVVMALAKPQVWEEWRVLERSGKVVVIHRVEDLSKPPKRRGRPPKYPRQVINGREVPGWYARRLTGRPPGRPRKNQQPAPEPIGMPAPEPAPMAVGGD